MSRNSGITSGNPEDRVTPRERRVSRNLAGFFCSRLHPVTPRERRVSRNVDF